jgi:hypothetical protein
MIVSIPSFLLKEIWGYRLNYEMKLYHGRNSDLCIKKFSTMKEINQKKKKDCLRHG